MTHFKYIYNKEPVSLSIIPVIKAAELNLDVSPAYTIYVYC